MRLIQSSMKHNLGAPRHKSESSVIKQDGMDLLRKAKFNYLKPLELRSAADTPPIVV